jgi:hypothetical protein
VKKRRRAKRSPKPRGRKKRAGAFPVSAARLSDAELHALREEVERAAGDLGPARLNGDPEEVRRSVAKLVLSLVEFVRKLLERQAVRRVEEGTLTARETERVGLGLMRLEETIHDIARRFDLDPEDLNLELGPLGPLH